MPDRPDPDVLRLLAELRADDLPVHAGRTLAYVFDSGLDEVDQVAREAVAAFAGTNGLDPTAFPSLLAMENDLVGFAADLLDAPDGVVGTVTSGGTESVLLAVKAARDARPDVARPSMVLPDTAHAAFHKAAGYFGVEARSVPTGPDFRADVAAMAAATDDDTVLLVASAPSYAHGVVDPVGEIASVAAERGARCHVDACIGGWVLPFAAAAGRDVAGVDLRRRRCQLDLGGPAQVRLRAQGDVAAPPPHRRAAPAAVLRLGGLAGLHDAQPHDAVDALGRAAGRCLGGRPVAGRRGLPTAGRGGVRRHRRHRPRRRRDRRGLGRRPARLHARRARHRRDLRPVHRGRRDVRARVAPAAADLLPRPPAHHPRVHQRGAARRTSTTSSLLCGSRSPRPSPPVRSASTRRSRRSSRRSIPRPSPTPTSTGCSLRPGWPGPTAAWRCRLAGRRSTRSSTWPRRLCARRCCWRSSTG